MYARSNEDFAGDFELKDQMRRAGLSVMSNIAERFDRSGNREFVQFLTVAKGSIVELRSQFYVALDQEYVSPARFDALSRESEKVSKITVSLINYLQKNSHRGTKYKTS
jgi:four helix bundle protein